MKPNYHKALLKPIGFPALYFSIGPNAIDVWECVIGTAANKPQLKTLSRKCNFRRTFSIHLIHNTMCDVREAFVICHTVKMKWICLWNGHLFHLCARFAESCEATMWYICWLVGWFAWCYLSQFTHCTPNMFIVCSLFIMSFRHFPSVAFAIFSMIYKKKVQIVHCSLLHACVVRCVCFSIIISKWTGCNRIRCLVVNIENWLFFFSLIFSLSREAI